MVEKKQKGNKLLWKLYETRKRKKVRGKQILGNSLKFIITNTNRNKNNQESKLYEILFFFSVIILLH